MKGIKTSQKGTRQRKTSFKQRLMAKQKKIEKAHGFKQEDLSELVDGVWWSKSCLKIHNLRNVLKHISENCLFEDLEDDLDFNFKEDPKIIKIVKIIYTRKDRDEYYKLVKNYVEEEIDEEKTDLKDENRWCELLNNILSMFEAFVNH